MEAGLEQIPDKAIRSIQLCALPGLERTLRKDAIRCKEDEPLLQLSRFQDEPCSKRGAIVLPRVKDRHSPRPRPHLTPQSYRAQRGSRLLTPEPPQAHFAKYTALCSYIRSHFLSPPSALVLARIFERPARHFAVEISIPPSLSIASSTLYSNVVFLLTTSSRTDNKRNATPLRDRGRAND